MKSFCMERQNWKKMKKRCAIPEKKLKELESILQEAISLDDETEDNSRQRRLLFCDEIEQRSFFLHSLLKAEISSCFSAPSEKGHLIHIQRCFERLHHAYHDWVENCHDPTALLEYLESDGLGPECTASCFNTDEEEEEEEEEEEDVGGELTESIVSSTQMAEENEELYEDVVVLASPPPRMESVGVQTEKLDDDIDHELEKKSLILSEEEEENGEMTETTTTLLWNEKPPVAEEFYEDEGGAEEEESEESEEESEVVLQKKRERVVGCAAAGGGRRRDEVLGKVKKGMVMLMMGSAMIMGFMIGRFYYPLNLRAASNYCSFDYYYCYYTMGSGVLGGGRHHVFNMLPT